jgi:hypothetical protein
MPTSPLVTAANSGCLLGWALVLGWTLRHQLRSFRPGASSSSPPPLWATPLSQLVLLLELFCCIEVVRMLVGALRGNVVLGVALHYTRLLVCLAIFPLSPSAWTTTAVLLAWSVTEVGRYPFYIWPSPATEQLRYALPVLTFPIGAGVEALACYLALPTLQGALYYMVGSSAVARPAAMLPIGWPTGCSACAVSCQVGRGRADTVSGRVSGAGCGTGVR